MNRLAELRKAKGMTQQQLADASGVHRTIIGRIETGTIRADGITLRTALALSDALGVTPLDLVRK